MKKSTIFIQLAIAVAIIVVVNLISKGLYLRLDFTEDQRYTLSKATKDILKDLEEVITIKAYFTEELPAQLAHVRTDLRDQLIEYENLSGGNIVFEFINPNESEELKREAAENGIAPISINVIENDQRQQLQAFLGIVMKSGDRTEVIPLVRPESAVEYDLTTAIKKISIASKPKLAMLNGFGEAGINSYQQLLQQLSVLYDVETFNMGDTNSIPTYYRGLIWINPTDTIPSSEFYKIDQYLNQGGNLFLAYASVVGDLQSSSLSAANDVGIKSWLSKKGVVYGNDFVIDANCASVTVRQQQGFFTINSQVEFPYFPLVSNFEEHPTTAGLEGLLLPFTNSFTFVDADTSLRVNSLFYTSELSGVVQAPSFVDVQKQWTKGDFPMQEQILAASIEGIGAGDGGIVVVGNSGFIFNGEGQQAQQVSPDNVNFASNAIDWLADDTGLIELRTKAVTSRPLDAIEDSTKNIIKYGNVFAPILLLLIYAFIRKQLDNKKRQRWSQGDFA